MNEEKVVELLFQIDEQIHDLEQKYSEMKNEAGRSEADQLVAKKREHTASKIRGIIQTQYSKLQNGIYLSECCDAETRTLPVHTFASGYQKQCKQCGEKDPDTYQVEKSIEDLIEELRED